jgi:Cu/Ag efflux protein CusF
MKTNRWLAVTAVVGLVLIQSAAYAESITGNIVSVDASAMRLVVNHKAIKTGKQAEKAFSVNPNTKLNGFASLKDLKVGEKVTVKATTNPKTHTEDATSINLS